MWIPIETTTLEYDTTPAIDDFDNAHNYLGKHINGIRTNSDGTQNYVYTRKTNGPLFGYGELNKTYYDYFNSIYEGSQFNFSVVKNTYYLGML